MRQQALVPSGCQQWVHNPVAVSSNGEFAYSSALAVYIYGSNKGIVSLSRILARVSHSVTSISWNPSNPNLLAMSCADLSLKVFQLDTEREIASTQSKVSAKQSPPILHWSMHDANTIFVHGGTGLMTWNYQTGAATVIRTKGDAITAFAQSRAEPAKIAVGYNDGLIWIYDVNTRKGIEILGETRVTSLAFDPLSKDYLLAAMWNGYMKLLMTADGQAVPGTNYLKQPTGFRTICFMNTMPGTFLTVSDRSGVIQIWNVSKSEPMRRLKAGQAGLQSVTPVFGTSKVVLSVKDGTVMLYNVERSRIEWQTEGGHTETIFGCGFHPDDPNQLATCSYDSTIRLWDVTTNKATKAFIGAEGVLYSVTWSPDGKFIAASSSTGCSYVFSVEKGTLVKTNKHHSAPCYRVEWHPKEANLLASASTDKTVAVFRADGALTRSLPHPKGVCSVAWCPHEKLVLASTCEDGCAYVWDVSSKQGKATQVLKGHGARVFNLAWNPILPNVLLTGSDDTTARVWNVATGASIELRGHSSNVRGLLWHTEMPNVALTGSWDSSIMVWDTRRGACLAVVKDHHADVYGIASHRLRPFTVATTSRDTTLRLWDLASTFPAVQLRAVCGEPLCSQPGPDTAPGVLCGTASAASMASAKQLAESDAERFATLLGLLCPPGAPAELWDLALAAKAGKGGSVEFSTQDPQVPHKAAIRMLLNSKAQELEMRKSIKARGIGSAKKEDVIRDAAQAHLIAGNIEAYCRLSAEVGDWQEALAMAPAVGLEFWQGLMGQRAAQMAEEGATLAELKPYLLASGQAQELVSQLMEAQAYTEAFEVAAVASEGGYYAACGSAANGNMSRHNSLPAVQSGMGSLTVSDALPAAVRKLQAHVLMDNAKPVQAACCHMSVNDVEGALDKLQRGHEVVLAAALAMAMKSPSVDVHIEALARQCELAGDYAMAGRVLRKIQDCTEATELLAVRASSYSPGSADKVHTELRLGSPSQYLQNASTAGDPGHQIRYLLLGGNYSAAADVAISTLGRTVSSGSEPPPGLHRALMSIPASQLSSDKKHAVLAYAFYLGTVKAVEKGYGSIVPFLVKLTKTLGQSAGSSVTVTPAAVDAIEAQFTAKSGKEVRTAGSNIPSGGSKDANRISYLSQKQIQGPYVILEDNATKISLNEAVMLSHVVAFSPLASGAWLPV